MSSVILEEAFRERAARISGPIMSFQQFIMPLDTPNRNGRIYSTELVRRVIHEQRDNMRARALLGELGPMQDGIIRIANASHVITNMFIRENNWFAHIEVIGTPMGRALRDMLNANAAVQWSPCGTGTMRMGANVVEAESYQFITINACPYD